MRNVKRTIKITNQQLFQLISFVDATSSISSYKFALSNCKINSFLRERDKNVFHGCTFKLFFFNAANLLPDYFFFLEQRNDIIGLVRHTLHHRCYFYAEELARLFHVHAG